MIIVTNALLTIQNKKKNNNPFLKLVPSIGTFVKSDTRNLQLVTPISEAEKNSVSCYLKNICQSGIVTSNEIDHAVSSGVDLDQVSLGQLYMNFEEEKEQEAANDEPNDNLKKLLKEDSVEKAIIAATTVSATPPKVGESPSDDCSSKNSPTPKKQLTSSSSTNSSILNSLFFKTPQKKSSNQSSKESRVSDEFSDPFKTPVKTPKKPLQRTEEIGNQALAVDLFQTPRKEDSAATVDHSESWLKKTPLSKMKKKSPMPSPFLLSPVMMSPGTPAKDVSIASISFNQSESFLVTPSVVFQENSSKDNGLCLEISPSGSLHTPSPHSNDKDEPLVTPPFDLQVTTPNDKFSNANDRSFGAARTPRGATKNMTIDNQVMNTPLKALHEAAKRLFCDETGPDKTLVFLSPSKRFLSPSKRIPKRVQLLAVDTRYEIEMAYRT